MEVQPLGKDTLTDLLQKETAEQRMACLIKAILAGFLYHRNQPAQGELAEIQF